MPFRARIIGKSLRRNRPRNHHTGGPNLRYETLPNGGLETTATITAQLFADSKGTRIVKIAPLSTSLSQAIVPPSFWTKRIG